MDNKIPKLKKNINAFFLGEEGNVSKKDILKAGIFIAGVSTLVLSTSSNIAEANHCSHGSHSSHCSHGSHASHCNHGNHSSHSSHGQW